MSRLQGNTEAMTRCSLLPRCTVPLEPCKLPPLPGRQAVQEILAMPIRVGDVHFMCRLAGIKTVSRRSSPFQHP